MRVMPLKETLIVEFESDKKGYSDNEIVEAVVGLANTDGGSLYLGVEDDGTITGIKTHHEDTIGITAMIVNKER